MKTIQRMAVLACALAISAGCSSTEGTPTAGPTKPANPFATDVGVRPVRMASGNALSYLQSESASQVLCQALPAAQWQQLLGGKVGRRPARSVEPGCVVGSSEVNVLMDLMRPPEQQFTPTTQVAGHPVLIEPDGNATKATVALTGHYWTDESYPTARPLLEVSVIGYLDSMPETERRPILTKLLDALVPVLAAPGDPVPAVGENGMVAFRRTPLTAASLIDLPGPTQALQLCTALLDLRHDFDPSLVEIHARGECNARPRGRSSTSVSLTTQRDTPVAGSTKIAGRPASVDGDNVRVNLREGAAIELDIRGDGARELADQLVPLLV